MTRQVTSFAVRSAVRRSSQIGAAAGVLISVGVWLAVGVYVLLGDVQILSGPQAAWAYLAVGLLFLPTALSWAEMMSWVRGTGGSYGLVRATERPALTFLHGLAHLLGWAALGALVASSFAAYASGLLALVFPPLPDARLLVPPLVVFFMFANLTGYRSRRGAQILFLGGGIVVLLLLAGLMLPRSILGVVPIRPPGTGRLFTSVALLAAAMWASDVTFEMQSVHRRPLRVLLAGTLIGPGIGLLLMLVARSAIAPSVLNGSVLTVVGMIGDLIGPAGVPIMLAVGLVVTGATFQVITLASLRQIAEITYDGWLPDWLRKRHKRYGTPWRIIIVHALAVMGLVALFSLRQLGNLCGLAFLGSAFGLNLAAFMMSGHPQAATRTFRLPLGRLIPAIGVGASLLLLSVFRVQILLVGIAWLVVGFLALWRYGKEHRQEAQRGLTIFQDEAIGDVPSGEGVLVPLGHPERDVNLLAFGRAIARQRGGYVVALHIVTVPDQLRLDTGRQSARAALDTLETVRDSLEDPQVPVHIVSRLSRNVAQGILDSIAEEDPGLVVMGWHARTRPGVGLGHTLDEVASNVTCDLAVVRGDWPRNPSQILVPTRGGPNAPLAARLAQALTAETGGQVTLLNVVRGPVNQIALDEAAALLESEIELLPSRERVQPKVVVATNPVEGIVDESKAYDVLMLGASEESFLDQALFGPVPERIARQTDSPVAMVRHYRGLPSFLLAKVWTTLTDTLPSLDLEDQLAVYQRLRRGSRPSVNYFVLIILSAIIATLGLLLGSPAIIIGAMLVAPLMTPIVATGIGISFGDVRTLRTSIESTLQGVLAAIFIAILITAISPLKDVNSEILARTQPTLLDLFVALASGMAGAYAIARKEVGEALPGVAIAAALMPPVCTVGIGIALVDFRVAGGALLLFGTNLTAITLAATVVFLLLGIRPPEEQARRDMLRRGLMTSVISLLVISLPLAYILFATTARDQLNHRVTEIVESTVAEWENAEVENIAVERGSDELTVRTTLRTSRDVTQEDVDALDAELEETLNRSVRVRIFLIPLDELDSGA